MRHLGGAEDGRQVRWRSVFRDSERVPLHESHQYEEKLHAGQRFAGALPLAQTEWNQVIYGRLVERLPVRLQETLRVETVGIDEHLRIVEHCCNLGKDDAILGDEQTCNC